MKYDFIEMFTDIDDNLIANAKPAAQKPIEMRVEKQRSPWKGFAAAAACLAVVAVGGAFAVNALRSGSAVPSVSDAPLDSVVDLPSTQPNSPASSGKVSLIDTEIEFQDNIYYMTSAVDYDGIYMMAGFRQKEYGRGSIPLGVLAVKNNTDKPVALPKKEKDSSANRVIASVDGLILYCPVWEYEEQTDVILPGETYYWEMDFDTCQRDRIYHLSEYQTTEIVAAGKYDGTVVLNTLSDPNDPTGEPIAHSLNFTVNIGNWNVGDSVGGYVKEGTVDYMLERWGPESFTIRNDFPGVKFECDYKSIFIINDDGSKTKLFGGYHIGNYCICDINDDGYGDILAAVSFEPNGQRECAIVYDHKNGQFYAIADFDNYNCGTLVEADAGTSGMGGRVMFFAYDLETGERIKHEPLTFDMLKPCTFDENGEPVFITRCGLDPEDLVICF